MTLVICELEYQTREANEGDLIYDDAKDQAMHILRSKEFGSSEYVTWCGLTRHNYNAPYYELPIAHYPGGVDICQACYLAQREGE